jgi:HlyD family secretion protein
MGIAGIMNKKEHLFRKEPLQHLSAGDQFDQLIRVTDKKGWIALIAFFILFIVVGFWGFYGSIPTKVNGTCIMVKTGGIFTIATVVGGRITDLPVKRGAKVKKGDVIARIELPDLLNQIYIARDEVQQLMARLQTTTKQREEKRKHLLSNIQLLQKKKSRHHSVVKSSSELSDGLLEMKAKMQELQISLHPLALEELKEKQDLADATRQLNIVVNKYKHDSQIISPYDGTVVEVGVVFGSLVKPGDHILNMELSGKNIKNLEAAIYVSAINGKKVHPGMKVLITPSIIKKEEYGSMVGMVTATSHFPRTFGAITRVLGNERLASDIMKGGAPIEIQADFVPDAATKSGYKWTTSSGPPIKIQSGTLGQAQIIIKTQKPISLVLPLIKKTVS